MFFSQIRQKNFSSGTGGTPTSMYPPGFPINDAQEQHPNFVSNFLRAFNTSLSQPFVYPEPELAAPINYTLTHDFVMPGGDDGLGDFVGTNLSKNMELEEVEMAPPSAIAAAPNDTENITENGNVIKLSDKHVNTLFSYFQKK